MNKRALIVSFPRSGTHFLMNTLSMNLGYVNKHVNLEPLGFNFWVGQNVHWVLERAFKHSPPNTFVKSHHEIWFFEDVMERIFPMYDVFYISRNTKDVMNSYCRHINALPWLEGPKVKSGEELANSRPIGGMLRYQYQQHPMVGHKHIAHVSEWQNSNHKDKIIYVRYEDLNENFEETVDNIAQQIGRKAKRIIRPSRTESVVKDGEVFTTQ